MSPLRKWNIHPISCIYLDAWGETAINDGKKPRISLKYRV